jgi:hypothetical protein
VLEVINEWLSTPATNGAILAAVVALSILNGWKNK